MGQCRWGLCTAGQRFSAVLPPQDVWFLGRGCYWHEMCRGQGCCSTPYRAQNSPVPQRQQRCNGGALPRVLAPREGFKLGKVQRQACLLERSSPCPEGQGCGRPWAASREERGRPHLAPLHPSGLIWAGQVEPTPG